MNDIEHLQALLQEAGPLLDPQGISWFEEENAWAIAMDEHTQIDLFHDAERGRLICVCDLGPVPAERRPKVHELLLRLNYLWQDHGGLRAAIDDAHSAALLSDWSLQDLDATALQQYLGAFAAAAADWRELVQTAPSAEPAASESAGFGNTMPPSGIRA
jgi:hypothetical protein